MAQGGNKLVKFMLFIFNFVFFLTGVAIIIGSALVLTVFSEYAIFTDNIGNKVPIVLICIGSFILLVGFFGCCGAMRENYCMLYVYAGIIVFLLVLEAGAGITGFVLKDDVSTQIDKNMKDTMPEYFEFNVTRKLWDDMQHDLKCCGTNNYTEWYHNFNNTGVPKSCCRNSETCDNYNIPTDPEEAKATIYIDGCAEALKDYLQENLVAIIIICVIIALIEITGIFCACCLMQSVKNEYEVV